MFPHRNPYRTNRNSSYDYVNCRTIIVSKLRYYPRMLFALVKLSLPFSPSIKLYMHTSSHHRNTRNGTLLKIPTLPTRTARWSIRQRGLLGLPKKKIIYDRWRDIEGSGTGFFVIVSDKYPKTNLVIINLLKFTRNATRHLSLRLAN